MASRNTFRPCPTMFDFELQQVTTPARRGMTMNAQQLNARSKIYEFTIDGKGAGLGLPSRL